MNESPETEFKPADRRWNLFGMVIGTMIGALPAAIPDPVGPFINWVALGVLYGFITPFCFFLHGHWDALRDARFCWFLGITGAVIGGFIGAGVWFIGTPVKPELGLAATCTGGFFAGFFLVDRYLKRLDARRLEEERLWGRHANP